MDPMEIFKENTQRDGFRTANGKPCAVGAAGVTKSREIASGVDQAPESVWSELISQELSDDSPDPSASKPDPTPKVNNPGASAVPPNGAVKRQHESTSGTTSPVEKFVEVTSPVQSPRKLLGLTSPARKLPGAFDEKKLPVRSVQSSAFKSPILTKPVATRTGAKGIVSKSPNLVLTSTEMQDIAQLSETNWNDMFEDVLDESTPSSFAQCCSSKRLLTDAERREVEEWGRINFDDDF